MNKKRSIKWKAKKLGVRLLRPPALKRSEREDFASLGPDASTCVALGTIAGALVARQFGYGRVASSLIDVTVGAVTGTVASDVGKSPVV